MIVAVQQLRIMHYGSQTNNGGKFKMVKKVSNYDFAGYATKNDIQCSDGRIIRHNAFADQDGQTVPLV